MNDVSSEAIYNIIFTFAWLTALKILFLFRYIKPKWNIFPGFFCLFVSFFWPMSLRQFQSHSGLFLLRGKKNGINQIMWKTQCLYHTLLSVVSKQPIHHPIHFQIYSQLNKHRGKQRDAGNHKASWFAPVWASSWQRHAVDRISWNGDGHWRAEARWNLQHQGGQSLPAPLI